MFKYILRSLYRPGLEPLLEKSLMRPSVAPEGAARNLINYLKLCYLSLRWLGLKTTTLKMKKS